MIKYSMEFPVAERRFWLPFCDMEFVLAHKVLEDEAYADELRNRPGGSPPVILDNSMHELGKPLPVFDIIAAAKLCRPDWVIPPDLLGRFHWNLDQLTSMVQASRGAPWKVASVICGKTADQRLASLITAQKLGCEMACYPYREDRWSWVNDHDHYRQLVAYSPTSHIHLLGVSSLAELRQWADLAKRTPLTFSVDTAKAYKWGMSGDDVNLLDSLRSSPIGSADLLDVQETPEHRLRSIIQNIHTLKAACQGR